MATDNDKINKSESVVPFNISKKDHRELWVEALRSPRPVLVHLNADTTWLLQLPYPVSVQPPPGRRRYNILLDPWLQGPQSDVASWFSTQWHVTAPSVQTMAELNRILQELEGDATDGQWCIDIVAISHEFTDHCHRATLLELPKSTPIFATELAADLIRSWRHFERVVTTPGFDATTKWEDMLSISPLPPWLGIGRVITQGNALYYHSALIVTLCLGGTRDDADSNTTNTTEAVIYSPHGIQSTDLVSVRRAGIQTLALLHGLHDVRIWMTKQLNLGALNGVQAVGESGARYWIATHDEVKTGRGFIAPLLRRTKYTLKDAVAAEEKRLAGKAPDYRFVELGSGDGVVLA